MKILEVSEHSYFHVKVDSSYWPNYRRNGPEDWENLMGESWEAIYDCEDLEKAFTEFVS
jgi:hypothetical protein